MNALAPSHERLRVLRDQVDALCRRHHVRRLDLFGSTARGKAVAGSDYDFLVEFEPLPAGGYADAYFGLLEDLQSLLEAPVELLVERAIRNPYLKRSLQDRRESVYAA
jgi:predicted nucleotidyltransferase